MHRAAEVMPFAMQWSIRPMQNFSSRGPLVVLIWDAEVTSEQPLYCDFCSGYAEIALAPSPECMHAIDLFLPLYMGASAYSMVVYEQ